MPVGKGSLNRASKIGAAKNNETKQQEQQNTEVNVLEEVVKVQPKKAEKVKIVSHIQCDLPEYLL